MSDKILIELVKGVTVTQIEWEKLTLSATTITTLEGNPGIIITLEEAPPKPVEPPKPKERYYEVVWKNGATARKSPSILGTYAGSYAKGYKFYDFGEITKYSDNEEWLNVFINGKSLYIARRYGGLDRLTLIEK